MNDGPASKGEAASGALRDDYFARARRWAVAAMAAAGFVAVIGSVLDWVTITPPPEPPPGIDFGAQEIEAQRATEPFTGTEARDGWWTLGAGLVLVVAAGLLLLRGRGAYGWLGLLASIVIGAVAVADYRAIGDLSSGLSRRMDVVGDADPALGITLVAAAALVGLVASGAGIAASPPPARA